MWKWLKALNPFESDNYHPWMREEIAALRAELDAAEIELADKAFYVREFAAVSEERDGARAEKQTLSDELQHVTAERDEARAEARSAIAHLRKRPEGLPTAEELKQVYRDGWNEGAGGDTCASGITAILAALAPWLREPVGWELDVTAEELSKEVNRLHAEGYGQSTITTKLLDLCRSRIRPAAQYGGWHFEDGKIVPNRMPEGVPVRSVRFDVTPEEACEAVEETVDRMADDDEVYMRNAMDYLAAHAVVLVPQPATPRIYTDDEVEKLARVLRETHAKTCGKVPGAYELDGFRNDARAAMDWMGAPMGKCKECEKLRKRGDKWADDCVKLAGAIKNARAALDWVKENGSAQ